MILAIDMGNSNIVIGGIDNTGIYFVERVTTNHGKTELEYAVNIKDIMEIHNMPLSSIEGAILSSVVPPLTDVVVCAVKKNNRQDTHGGRLRNEDRTQHQDGQP